MDISLVIAIISGLFTIITNVVISWANNKKTQALLEYRLGEIEKKQDKHNSIIERTYKLEQKVDDLEKRIK